MLHDVKIADFQIGDVIEGFYILKDPSAKTTANGRPYLQCQISDCSGFISAYYWDYPGPIGAGEIGHVVKVRGEVTAYRGGPQFTGHRIRLATEKDEYDRSVLVPTAPIDPEERMQEIRDLVQSMEDADYRRICEVMLDAYKRRMDGLDEKLYPIIKEVYEKQGSMYQNIAIPVSDGRKVINLSVNLQKAYESEGKEISKTLSKNIILYQIDEHWKEHLREMDDLKQSVQNAAYEQKDPIVVYKLESYNLFSDMLESLNQDVLSFLFRAFVPLSDRSAPPQRAMQQRKPDMSQMQTQHNDLSTNGEQKANTPVKVDKHVGRNDPCPCGSGKKFKNCHGKGLV